MANSLDDTLSAIAQYAAEVKTVKHDPMEVDETDSEARLEQTVTELQSRLEQQRLALEELRLHSSGPIPTVPSPDSRERLQQLRLIKAAYDRLTPSEPTLPSPGSLLPAILATRVAQQSLSNSKENIQSTRSRLSSTSQRIKEEETQLNDSKLLHDALANRISRLQQQRLQKSQMTPEQAAKELVQVKHAQRKTYDLETMRLQTALDNFIDGHLAAMLAAEELGGPVVGDIMDVDDELLEAGFNQQGKPKTNKTSSAASKDKNQRRIDEIWGTAEGDDGPTSAKDAAAAEMRELLSQLYDALLGHSESGVYIQLDRDLAAARFLVRAKVAQFHPKDARRLRLIDFGRELDE